MEYKEFKELKVHVGMKFVVKDKHYWLAQIHWTHGYITGYMVRTDETLSEFNELDVDNEDSMDYRMEDTFGCCVVDRVFDQDMKDTVNAAKD